jgi:hypothetical protein
LAIFEDIRLVSSVDAAPKSRKEYLAKLFGILLRISTRRMLSVNPGQVTEQGNDHIASRSRIDASDNNFFGQTDGMSANLQHMDGWYSQRLLEQSIDEFVSQ